MFLRKPLAFLLLLSGTLAAQPGGGGGSYIDPRYNAAQRKLQAGDVLEINVFSLPELEKKYSVRADGTLFHPFAGQVAASGKTLTQLELELKKRLTRQLKQPAFRLSLSSMGDGEAAVLGEVHAQGKFKFVPGSSVMDLLAQAGGVSEKADLDGAVILRAGQKITLDLSPAHQAELSRMEVQAGDILYVNRGLRIGVSGEIQNNGVYALSAKSMHPLEDSIKAAGGAKETAALHRVQIVRPGLPKALEVNLLKPEEVAKITLEDGDMVVVPPRKAVVLGAVTKAGAIPLNGNESLVDVLSVAGLSSASIESVVVIRAENVRAAQADQKEVYNLKEGLGQGQPLVYVPIHDGDLVYVPTKEQDTGGMFGPAGQSLMSILVMARSLFAF